MRDSYHCDYVLLPFVVKKHNDTKKGRLWGGRKRGNGCRRGAYMTAGSIASLINADNCALIVSVVRRHIHPHTHKDILICTYTAAHTLTHTSNKVFAVVAFNTNTLYLVPAARCCCCYLLLLLLHPLSPLPFFLCAAFGFESLLLCAN